MQIILFRITFNKMRPNTFKLTIKCSNFINFITSVFCLCSSCKTYVAFLIKPWVIFYMSPPSYPLFILRKLLSREQLLLSPVQIHIIFKFTFWWRRNKCYLNPMKCVNYTELHEIMGERAKKNCRIASWVSWAYLVRLMSLSPTW